MRGLPSFVIKKGGHKTRFDRSKLERSIRALFQHCRIEDPSRLRQVSEEVLSALVALKKTIIDTETVRDQVVLVLNRHHLHKTADAYDLAFLHLKKSGLVSVVKRDGSRTGFYPPKIFKSIRKSFRDAGIDDPHHVETVTHEVIDDLKERFAGHGAILTTEDIKQVVATRLKKHRLPSVLRAYLSHRYF